MAVVAIDVEGSQRVLQHSVSELDDICSGVGCRLVVGAEAAQGGPEEGDCWQVELHYLFVVASQEQLPLAHP